MTSASSRKIEPVQQRIEASTAEVFAAWVTREDIEDWWGPEGFTTVVKQLDVAEGGRFSFEMTAPDGTRCRMEGVYKTIDPPTLLVFEVVSHCNLSLPHGVRPQLEPSLVTVQLVAEGSATNVLISQSPLNDTYSEVAKVSWGHVLGKLALSVRQARRSHRRN